MVGVWLVAVLHPMEDDCVRCVLSSIYRRKGMMGSLEVLHAQLVIRFLMSPKDCKMGVGK